MSRREVIKIMKNLDAAIEHKHTWHFVKYVPSDFAKLSGKIIHYTPPYTHWACECGKMKSTEAEYLHKQEGVSGERKASKRASNSNQDKEKT